MPDAMKRPLIFDNALEAIGKTPLIRLHRVIDSARCSVLAKVEYFNPGGSVKDRPAYKMLLEAEKAGLVKSGSVIVEATSGNTGTGLAMAAAIRGYRCILVMPDKMSKEKVDLLRAYGAEVVITPTNVAADSPESYYNTAQRLVSDIPGAFMPNQWHTTRTPTRITKARALKYGNKPAVRSRTWCAVSAPGAPSPGRRAFSRKRIRRFMW
jgi:cystathionine beta-synthase